jgi:hypothetical protein
LKRRGKHLAMCKNLLEEMDADMPPDGFVFLLRIMGHLEPCEDPSYLVLPFYVSRGLSKVSMYRAISTSQVIEMGYNLTEKKVRSWSSRI